MLDIKYAVALVIGFLIGALYNITKDAIATSTIAAIASAIAAGCSAWVAYRTYKKQEEQELYGKDERLIYIVGQLVILYNKLFSSYFGGSRNYEVFEKATLLDRENFFNEENPLLYNLLFPNKINEKMIELVEAVSFWKASVPIKPRILFYDYYYVVKMLDTILEILFEIYCESKVKRIYMKNILSKLLKHERISEVEENIKDSRRIWQRKHSEYYYVMKDFDRLFYVTNQILLIVTTSKSIEEIEKDVVSKFVIKISNGQLEYLLKENDLRSYRVTDDISEIVFANMILRYRIRYNIIQKNKLLQERS